MITFCGNLSDFTPHTIQSITEKEGGFPVTIQYRHRQENLRKLRMNPTAFQAPKKHYLGSADCVWTASKQLSLEVESSKALKNQLLIFSFILLSIRT